MNTTSNKVNNYIIWVEKRQYLTAPNEKAKEEVFKVSVFITIVPNFI